jgi:hypothetical protein
MPSLHCGPVGAQDEDLLPSLHCSPTGLQDEDLERDNFTALKPSWWTLSQNTRHLE